MTALTTSAQPSAFAVFRSRSFRLMWTAQLISTIGDALASLAAGILIFRLTGSALSVGLMLVATAVPTLFVGLIAGVFVDRYDRKRIMIAADLLRAILVFLIPVLVPYSIVWLYVIVLLASAVAQFFDPAHASVLPEVASEEELAAANSMIAISSFGSTAVGFAASGLIASRFPIEWAFYLDALTFAASALFIGLIRIQPIEVGGETTVATVVENLKAGAKFLYDNAVLRSTLFVVMLYALAVGMWNTLLLPFAIRALNATEFEYGLQEGLTSVGFVIGSLMMARLADRLREGQWMVISLVGMGIVGAIYAGANSIPLAIVLVMVSGFLNAPSAVARALLFQRNTTREIRGRVFSTLFVVRDVLLLIGMAAAGLADLFDVRLVVLAAAIITAGGGLLALVLPGLGQPAAEWRRAIRLLRGVAEAPELGVGRAALLADLDRFASRLPAFSALSTQERQSLLKDMRYIEAPSGTAVVRYGEVSDAAYFILEGRAVAGRVEDGQEQVLEVLNAGDFFGEIAALTGVPRTANVVIEEPGTLLRVPAATLRQMVAKPELNRLFLSKMTERMVRMNMLDLPRFAGLDQQSLRELRTPDPQPVA